MQVLLKRDRSSTEKINAYLEKEEKIKMGGISQIAFHSSVDKKR